MLCFPTEPAHVVEKWKERLRPRRTPLEGLIYSLSWYKRKKELQESQLTLYSIRVIEGFAYQEYPTYTAVYRLVANFKEQATPNGFPQVEGYGWKESWYIVNDVCYSELPIPACPLPSSECAMPESRPRQAPLGDVPKFVCAISIAAEHGEGRRHIGCGFRYSEFLVTARHVWDELFPPGTTQEEQSYAFYLTNSACTVTGPFYLKRKVALHTPISAETVELPNGLKIRAYEFSFHDCAYIPLSTVVWSQSGVAMCGKQTAVVATSSIGSGRIYGWDCTRKLWQYSDGDLSNLMGSSDSSGLLKHNCSTSPGWSGSPILCLAKGCYKPAGLHIAGWPGKSNYAISGTTLVQTFYYVTDKVNYRCLNIVSAMSESGHELCFITRNNRGDYKYTNQNARHFFDNEVYEVEDARTVTAMKELREELISECASTLDPLRIDDFEMENGVLPLLVSYEKELPKSESPVKDRNSGRSIDPRRLESPDGWELALESFDYITEDHELQVHGTEGEREEFGARAARKLARKHRLKELKSEIFMARNRMISESQFPSRSERKATRKRLPEKFKYTPAKRSAESEASLRLSVSDAKSVLAQSDTGSTYRDDLESVVPKAPTPPGLAPIPETVPVISESATPESVERPCPPPKEAPPPPPPSVVESKHEYPPASSLEATVFAHHANREEILDSLSVVVTEPIQALNMITKVGAPILSESNTSWHKALSMVGAASNPATGHPLIMAFLTKIKPYIQKAYLPLFFALFVKVLNKYARPEITNTSEPPLMKRAFGNRKQRSSLPSQVFYPKAPEGWAEFLDMYPRFCENNTKSWTTHSDDTVPDVQDNSPEITHDQFETLVNSLLMGDLTAFTQVAEFNFKAFMKKITDACPQTHPKIAQFNEYIKRTRATSEVDREVKVRSKNNKPAFTSFAYMHGGGNKKSRGMKKLSPSDIELGKEHNFELGQLGVPVSDYSTMISSLASHTELRREGCLSMTSEQFQELLDLHSEEDREIAGHKPCISLQDLTRVALDFKDTSVGYSQYYNGRMTKSDFYRAANSVGTDQEDYVLEHICAVRLLLQVMSWRYLPFMKPEEMFNFGLSDPKTMFVKNEPHSERKLEQGRARMIWNPSYVDAIIQKALINNLSERQSASYERGLSNLSAIGLGHHDAGLERLSDDLYDLSQSGPSRSVGSVYVADASAWDFSVSREALLFSSTLRSQLSCLEGVSHEGYTGCMIANGLIHSAHTLHVGSTLLSSDWYGIQASGLPSTSQDNSFNRHAGLTVAGCTNVMCCGDDAVCSNQPSEEILLSHGTISRAAKEVRLKDDNPVSFTSHSFWPGPKKNGKGRGFDRVTFDNTDKLVFGLIADFRALEARDGTQKALRLYMEPGTPQNDSVVGRLHCLRLNGQKLSDFIDLCEALSIKGLTRENARYIMDME